MTCSLRPTAAMVFASCRNESRSISCVNFSMATIASSMSANEREAPLKGKDSLALGFVPNWLFQCFGGREVHTNAEQVSQPVLDGNHIHKRESSSRIKLGNNI